MPTELFDLYETIMSRITQSKDKLALRTLSWVVYAKRPLHIDELQEAVAIEEGDRGLDQEDLTPAQTIVEVCGSFIVYDKDSGVVELAHETVKEFLLSHHSCQLSPEVVIAKMCLNYLLFDVFNFPCPDIEALLARFRKFSLSRYATQFWGIHTRGEAENFPHIQHAVLSLLASENKNSMLQMESYADSPWGDITFIGGQTLLHLIAAKGLGTMCRLVFGMLNQSDRYVSTMQSMLTIIERYHKL
jgi:hypothetical protein